MSRKLFVLILFIFICFIDLSYATTYYTGDTFEAGGKTVTIVKISQNNAVVDVGGIKNIIMVDEQKTVNGVMIKVIKVFYVDEPESRNVDLAIIGTTSSAPSASEDEEDSGTSGDECWQASDCDDNNPETTDLCMGTPKKCKNIVVEECETSEDCDDGNKCTKDECTNNECFNTKISDCTEKDTGGGGGTAKDATIAEETQEKQGFFRRLMNFFKGLFSF